MSSSTQTAFPVVFTLGEEAFPELACRFQGSRTACTNDEDEWEARKACGGDESNPSRVSANEKGRGNMLSVGVGVPDAQVSIYMKSEEGCSANA